jgi:hypothetical protein
MQVNLPSGTTWVLMDRETLHFTGVFKGLMVKTACAGGVYRVLVQASVKRTNGQVLLFGPKPSVPVTIPQSDC